MFTLIALLACASSTPAPADPPADPAPPAAAEPAGAVSEISVQQLHDGMSDVVILVDVRTVGEFEGGHVPGAVNIPLDQLGDRAGELADYRDGPVHLICHSGGRSARAASQLAALGYQSVNVAGGTSAWMEQGFPTE